MRESAEPLALRRGFAPPAVLLPTRTEPDAILPADPRTPLVFARLASRIRVAVPSLRPTHVGATASPGVPSDGVIQIEARIDPDRAVAIAEALVESGWHWNARGALVAAIDHEGTRFRARLELIAEPARQRTG